MDRIAKKNVKKLHSAGYPAHKAGPQRLLNYIRKVDLWQGELGETSTAESFEALALAVFRYQFESNVPYRTLCQRRGITPASVARWQDIPSVATASFKQVPLFCGDAREATRVFHTSGTTRGSAGKHYFRSLDIYKMASLRVFKWACLPDIDQMPVLVLGPTAEAFPHSSLGQMFSWIVQEFGTKDSRSFFTADHIDFAGATAWLQEKISEKALVLILATSLALLSWCEREDLKDARLRLPEGSRIVDTGGYKGKKRDVNRIDFLQLVASRFRIHPEWIFNEYGMTEMSSQFYESRFLRRQFGPGAKVGPPWVKSLACDPATLAILPAGQEGVLRYFDLANLDSVAMLQTEDFGRVDGRRLYWTGRAFATELRGCSLLAEQILAKQSS